MASVAFFNEGNEGEEQQPQQQQQQGEHETSQNAGEHAAPFNAADTAGPLAPPDDTAVAVVKPSPDNLVAFHKVVPTRKLSRPANVLHRSDVAAEDCLKHFAFLGSILAKGSLRACGPGAPRRCPGRGTLLLGYRAGFAIARVVGFVLTIVLLASSADSGDVCCVADASVREACAAAPPAACPAAGAAAYEEYCGANATLRSFEELAGGVEPALATHAVGHAAVLVLGGYDLFATQRRRRPPASLLAAAYIVYVVATLFLLGGKAVYRHSSCAHWKEEAARTLMPATYHGCLAFVDACANRVVWLHVNDNAAAFGAAASAAAALVVIEAACQAVSLAMRTQWAMGYALVA